MSLKKYADAINIADMLTDAELNLIGTQVNDNFSTDKTARADKDKTLTKANELLMLTPEVKNHPWQNAANVKFPLLTNAVNELNAQLMPLAINNGRVVSIKTYGKDSDPVENKDGSPVMSEESGAFVTKNEATVGRATKVRDFMDWGMIDREDSDWVDEEDRLINVYASAGWAVKKMWFDEFEMMPKSELIMPLAFYWEAGKTFEKSTRQTHMFDMAYNELIEYQRAGIFREVSYVETEDTTADYGADEKEYIEQHCFLDLDDDGYKEPYIVTVHVQTQQVLRIVARYTEDDIVYKDKKVVRIKPRNNFIFFSFMPAPDGSEYPIGFSDLLLHSNEGINTVLNQLLDAGTLANVGGGFISGNLRVQGGKQSFAIGEYKTIKNNGFSLRENIYDIPRKEPSIVLFQLLSVLIEAGKDTAMIKSVLSGELAANIAPTTVLAIIEQGMSNFKAIYKRFHNASRKEFKLYYDLTRENLERIKEQYPDIKFIQELSKGDFKDDYSIVPVSDSFASTSMEKKGMANFYMSLAENPIIDQKAAMSRAFELMGEEDYEDLFVEQAPNPMADAANKMQLDTMQANLDSIQANTAKTMKAVESTGLEDQLSVVKTRNDTRELESNIVNRTADTQSNIMKRNSESIKNMSLSEQKEDGKQNAEYIEQLNEIGTVNTAQAKQAEEVLDEQIEIPTIVGREL